MGRLESTCHARYRWDSDEKGLFIKEKVDWSPHAMLGIEGISNINGVWFRLVSLLEFLI